MKKILLLSCHPDIQKSFGNKALLNAVKDLEGVTIMDIYKEEFTVDTYRKAFDEADILLFQFPFYWGSAPSMLKKWSDEIFIQLIDNMAGKGKKIMVALTAGAAKSEFCSTGYNLYPVETLVSPYHLQANFSGMGWLPPFAIYDMENPDRKEQSAAEGAVEYRRLLTKLVNE